VPRYLSPSAITSLAEPLTLPLDFPAGAAEAEADEGSSFFPSADAEAEAEAEASSSARSSARWAWAAALRSAAACCASRSGSCTTGPSGPPHEKGRPARDLPPFSGGYGFRSSGARILGGAGRSGKRDVDVIHVAGA
jgi:hypothetical protein